MEEMLAPLTPVQRDRLVASMADVEHGSLGEAIALYRTAGYAEIPRFGDDPYAEHWFEKFLVVDAGRMSVVGC